ncbi:MAG: hypothetical protein HYZ75_09205 [Elusimicrobia bacterium]|nr:hypothetical protein [Elusimicrobiota bacterium]
MLTFLLAALLAVVPASHLHAQEDGGGDQGMAEEGGGDQGGGEQGGGEQGGDDQSGGQQQDGGGEQGGGDQYGGEQQDGGGDSSGAGNIVGSIAADNGPDEELAKPKTKRSPKSMRAAKRKAASAKSARLRRRRGASAKVGDPAQPTTEAEPKFPELDLPELKPAAPKKEPAPPVAPLVALNPALP